MDEVTIRAVVNDKRGNPVRELALKEFAIYEDGHRQTITAFSAKGDEYFFTYKPTIPVSKGGIRTIKIKVHKRGMRVNVSRGYTAYVSKSAQDQSETPK